ncbi:MAG: patatin-like phospholipase family protein [Isosphaeraceae bacterium]
MGFVPGLKAYAIFDGGGVLGAALAGCLCAAQEYGIEFVGYGGTSAGSLIATLGAVGYSGDELKQAVIGTDFRDFLRDRGRLVAEFQAHSGHLLQLASGMGPRSLWTAWRSYAWIQERIGRDLGIDDGKVFKDKLRELIANRHSEWREGRTGSADITFDMLARKGLPPLKIVASDVIGRRPVVLWSGDGVYTSSVLEAVRASTAYPLVFRPVAVQRRWLVDGGLSSNLPASLFHREQRTTGYPVFAFDLIGSDRAPGDDYPWSAFIKDMITTAIDAGDDFLRDMLTNIHHIRVEIPPSFDVLDFAINEAGRRELFNIGYSATNAYLDQDERLRLIRQHSAADEADLQKRLQAVYGEPELYAPILAAVARDIEAHSKAKRLRVTVMLPTGRDTRIVVYSHGMKRVRRDGSQTYDPDMTLEIKTKSGVSGRAWEQAGVIAGDLSEARRNPGLWNLDEAITARVPESQLSMISVRIHGRSVDEQSDPLGTLTVDSATALADTSWLESESNEVVRQETVSAMQGWANVLRHVLLSDA